MNRVLFLLILICTTPLYAADIWNRGQVVDGWSVGRYTSLAILPSGQPAISYYDYIDGDLEYAWFKDGQWHLCTVDDVNDVGSHTSIAILPSGRPAISYLDRTDNDLKYAELKGDDPFDSSHWKIIVIDHDAVAAYTSLAVHLPSGRRAISYSRADTIRYAWSDDGTKWHIDNVVDTIGADGGQTSLVLPWEDKDRAMMSYYDGVNQDLTYAEVVGTLPDGSLIWDIAVVDSEGDVGRHNSLAILPSGHPAIAYRSRGGGGRDLKFASRQDDGWHVSVADSLGNTGRFCSLAILPEDNSTANCYEGLEQINLSGQHVISYYRPYRLIFGWFDGIQWRETTVDSAGDTGLYTSIKILPCGQPAISYHRTDYEGADGNLRYAWFEGFGWYDVVVDPGHHWGTYTSLAISPLSDLPAISFHDVTYKHLCYAWFDPDKGWQNAPVDKADVGMHTSLAFLPSGRPAISYYARAGRNLKYAELVGDDPSDPNAWDPNIVDDAPNTGEYSSLAISPLTGQPAISYTSNDDLRYAWYDGSTWHAGYVVDGKEDVGYHTSLAFLPSGKPIISYRNDTEQDLMYAELVGEKPRNPNDWQTAIIDSDGNVGQYTSIAIWCGQPAISYYDATNRNLKFAWFKGDDRERTDGSKWEETKVDDGINTGEYTSLAIVFDKPAISYYSNGDLKYAELLGSDSANPDHWKIIIVDTGGGTYTSLATLLSGQPVISYYHAGTGDLKYAFRFSE